MAGLTQSTNFPGTAGGAQPILGGGGADASVARLDRGLTGGQPGLPIFIVTSCRVLDTRDPPGPFGGPAHSGATRTFIIARQCNIPIGARAIFANITITNPTAPGHLSIFPAGTTHYGIFLLGTNGGISGFDGQPSGTVDFILDAGTSRSGAMKKALWLMIAIAVVASRTVGAEVAGERARLDEKLGRVEIPFAPNIGLTDPAVAFSAPTFAGTAFVTRKGQIVYSLASGAQGSPGWTLTETPVNSGALRAAGQEPSETRVSYFLGDDPARWRSDVKTYRSVSLGEAWPGVSLLLRAYGNSIEKLFTVEPGADPSRIRMRVDGARSLRLDRDGSLLVATGVGQVRFTAPIAFQEKDGVRHPVSVAYRMDGSRYGFILGDYDPDVALVIDPLLQATYLGGGDDDRAAVAGLLGGAAPGPLAIHPTSGEVYVAGVTNSTNFPGTAGGAQPAFGGGTVLAFGDAFVARLNASLTTLAQATYLGGSAGDRAVALAIHPTSGEVYVGGDTFSTNFPGTAGGAQPAFAGSTDGFVARLSASLTTLAQATYLGGTSGDQVIALAIHPTSGEIYAAGTSSLFPGTAGGAQPALAAARTTPTSRG